MFGSDILEVAVGLAFIYLLLSLICSAVVETIAVLPFTNWRGWALNRALTRLLGSLWTADLKTHPLIRGSLPDSSLNFQSDKTTDHIEPKNFVNALISTLVEKSGENEPSQNMPDMRIRTGIGKLFEIPKDTGFSNAGSKILDILDIIKEAPTKINAEDSKKRNDLIESINQVVGRWVLQPSEPLKDSQKLLNTLFLAANKNPTEFPEVLEAWFETEMKRVSAWYKRWTSVWLSIAAVIAVTAFDVDTINVANTLWNDPVLRSNVADMASKKVKDLEKSDTEFQEAMKKCNEFIKNPSQPTSGTNGNTKTTIGSPPTKGSSESIKTAINFCNAAAAKAGGLSKTAQESLGELQKRKLPIGNPGESWGKQWNTDTDPTKTDLQRDWGALLSHAFGLVVSAIMISLGAPFWFDTLNRLVNVRLSGRPKTDGTGTAKTS
jgi:hypothetical protein